jgi:hypothetical protein
MGCERYRDNLSAYLDGFLSDSEKRIVKDHVKVCSSCRAELQALGRVAILASSLPEIKAPADFLFKLHERIDRASLPWWRKALEAFESRLDAVPLKSLSAAAAVVLLVAVFVSQQEGSKVQKLVFGGTENKLDLPELLAANTNAIPVEFASTRPSATTSEPVYLDSPNDLIYRIVNNDPSFRQYPLLPHPRGQGVLIDTPDNLIEVVVDPAEFPLIQSYLEQQGGKIPSTLREAMQVFPIYVTFLPSPHKSIRPDGANVNPQ